MSHFQRSAWHTVTWMALLTFVLNNVSLLNLDSLFFYRSFIGGNSMFNTRLTQGVLTDRKHCTVKCPELMVKLYQHLLLICPLTAWMSTAISFSILSRVPTTSPCDTNLPPLSTHMCREARRNYIWRQQLLLHLIWTSSWPDAFLRQGTNG